MSECGLQGWVLVVDVVLPPLILLTRPAASPELITERRQLLFVSSDLPWAAAMPAKARVKHWDQNEGIARNLCYCESK